MGLALEEDEDHDEGEEEQDDPSLPRARKTRNRRDILKRSARNSLQLLIHNERNRSYEFGNDDEDYTTCEYTPEPKGSSHPLGSSMPKVNVIEKVAFYENPGILMIIQSADGGEQILHANETSHNLNHNINVTPTEPKGEIGQTDPP